MDEEAKTFWYVEKYMDEVVPHEPTLEGAAFFLLHGRRADELAADAHYADQAPLAMPGSIIDLSGLRILCESTAFRSVGADGSASWRFDPPIPEEADFTAVQWDAETSDDPRREGFQEAFAETWADEDEVTDVVFAKHIERKAQYAVYADGKPSLTLLPEGQDKWPPARPCGGLHELARRGQ